MTEDPVPPPQPIAAVLADVDGTLVTSGTEWYVTDPDAPHVARDAGQLARSGPVTTAAGGDAITGKGRRA